MDNKKFQEMIDEFTLDSDAIKDVAASLMASLSSVNSSIIS